MVARRITSLQHPLVKRAVQLRQDRSLREQERAVVVAGKRLLQEIAPLKLLITDDPTLSIPAQETIIATPEILKKITGLAQNDGAAGIATLPKPASLANQNSVLILDGLSDPGNVGALLRTSLAFGWELVILTRDACDPFNDKAIRASKGACFRQPLLYSPWETISPWLQKRNFSVFAADLEGSPLSSQSKFTPPIALVLGHEIKGLSSSALQIGKLITIPMSGKIESLNVAAAGAILLYTLKENV